MKRKDATPQYGLSFFSELDLIVKGKIILIESLPCPNTRSFYSLVDIFFIAQVLQRAKRFQWNAKSGI